MPQSLSRRVHWVRNPAPCGQARVRWGWRRERGALTVGIAWLGPGQWCLVGGLECTGWFYSTVPRCCCCCCGCCCCLCWGWEEPWGGELVHRTAGNRKGCYWKNRASSLFPGRQSHSKAMRASRPLQSTHAHSAPGHFWGHPLLFPALWLCLWISPARFPPGAPGLCP